MNNVEFKVLAATDRDYWEAFVETCRDIGEKPALAEFTYAFGGEIHLPNAGQLDANDEVRAVFESNAKLFTRMLLRCTSGREIVVQRSGESIFDEVSCRPPNREDRDQLGFAKFTGSAQRNFGIKGAKAQPFLPAEREKFYQAQEAAIQQLTTAIAHAGHELETTRSRLNHEFEKREAALHQSYVDKDAELEKRFAERDKQLNERNSKAIEEISQQRAAVEAQRKELDDRNATHARRQHQTEIDKLFETLEKEFGVTKGTTQKGYLVLVVTTIAALISGGVAAYFLAGTLEIATDVGYVSLVRLIGSMIKAVVFTAITVSLVVFLIRWLNQWFQRHANEEFRLKRLRLDVKRAIWFVETAREWSNSKEGAPMPKELVDRLTAGLFFDATPDAAHVEPRDALASVLLGGSKTHVVFPGGSVEYDRRDLKKLDS